MTLLLGDIAPDFTQDSTQGRISFHDWIGDSWCVFFSHPADFTPICTTELGRVAHLAPEFAKRNCKVIALSVDPLEDHAKWVGDIEEIQSCQVGFPIIADSDRSVSGLYGMIHPNADPKQTVRSVFVIDHNRTIRATFTYPPSSGRNFDEILRLVDSLQLTDNYKVATPVDWKDGDDVIIVPSLKDPEEMKKRFPKGWTEVRPYYRVTPQPNK